MREETEAKIQEILEGYIENPQMIVELTNRIKLAVKVESYEERLLTFHKRMKQHIGESFTLPPKQVVDLRLNLVIEEFSETVKAMGSEAYSSYGRKLFQKSQEIHYDVENHRESMIFNPTEVRDGFADTQVVLTGAIVSFGLHNNNLFEEDFHEVMDSNMSKACKDKEEALATQTYYEVEKRENSIIEEQSDGTWLVFRSSDKKLLKSINYTPANFNRNVVQSNQ